MEYNHDNMVKDPNRLEANKHWVAILQGWPRIWIRDYREQIQLAFRAGLELEASELQVQRSNSSATLPPLQTVLDIPRSPMDERIA